MWGGLHPEKSTGEGPRGSSTGPRCRRAGSGPGVRPEADQHRNAGWGGSSHLSEGPAIGSLGSAGQPWDKTHPSTPWSMSPNARAPPSPPRPLTPTLGASLVRSRAYGREDQWTQGSDRPELGVQVCGPRHRWGLEYRCLPVNSLLEFCIQLGMGQSPQRIFFFFFKSKAVFKYLETYLEE